MNEDARRYLTALGDALHVAAHIARDNAAPAIRAALRAGKAEDDINVGLMAGLRYEATSAAVKWLLAEGYVTGEKDTPSVSLTEQGAEWYKHPQQEREPPTTP